MRTLNTVKNKLLLVSALLWIAVISSSCKKEDLGPVYDPGQPRFYVKTEMQGRPLQIYSGKNDYITTPKIEEAKLLNVSLLSVYSSNFTNGADSFQVGIMDVQFPFLTEPKASKQALEIALDKAQNNPENIFADFAPGIGIRYIANGVLYTTPADADLQNGSYFRISKIEEYTPPGADHAMKKVDVTFRCRLVNYDNDADNFWLENGEATLLFDYLP